MTEDEFARWLPAARAAYAKDLARNGDGDEEAARRLAIEQSEQVFPGGRPSPDQYVFVVEADGAAVGELWFGERTTSAGPCLWIWDIRIDEAARGNGYGRAAMLFAEDEARRRGHDRLGLNVFGGNDVARNLYRSLGYQENAVFMIKTV